jgi:hypothetical protein
MAIILTFDFLMWVTIIFNNGPGHLDVNRAPNQVSYLQPAVTRMVFIDTALQSYASGKGEGWRSLKLKDSTALTEIEYFS